MNSHQTITLPIWPQAYGGPSGSGDIKTVPEDFIVEEILGFEPQGSGEHIFLFIEKIGENTEYVARLLARHAGVRQRDIGYAGLKDRHGRTKQWFSVWLPGKDEPNWRELESDNLKMLQTTRHARKLKRGVLAGNRFEIVIRNWQGDREQTERQLELIRQQGFPNYFGEQRFGHGGKNLDKAIAMFRGQRVKPEQRSIYLSAARSLLFNAILAERVENSTWNRALAGDVFMLDGSNSWFKADNHDSVLPERLQQGDVHPTGALFGVGASPAGDATALLEQGIIARYAEVAEGLLHSKVEADRRALRIKVNRLDWDFERNDRLRLAFALPAGSYATTLIREIVAIRQSADGPENLQPTVTES